MVRSCFFIKLKIETNIFCLLHAIPYSQGLLSVEDTTACCGLLNCGFSMGCNGGQPSGAWGWFHKTGVVTGGDYGDDNYCLPCTFAKLLARSRDDLFFSL